jgi:hypothetical protein
MIAPDAPVDAGVWADTCAGKRVQLELPKNSSPESPDRTACHSGAFCGRRTTEIKEDPL